MDHHVPRAIIQALRVRGIDVLTAYEDGADQTPDSEILERAAQLGRALFTQDNGFLSDYDFLAIAAEYQAEGRLFSGVIYAHQTAAAIGVYIRDLEVVAQSCEPDELHNQVLFLPL
jgi:hypothetical protein